MKMYQLKFLGNYCSVAYVVPSIESEEIVVPSIGFISTVVYWTKIMATFMISYFVGDFIVDNVNFIPHLSPTRVI